MSETKNVPCPTCHGHGYLTVYVNEWTEWKERGAALWQRITGRAPKAKEGTDG